MSVSGYSSAGFTNISTPDSIVHGVSRQTDNFAFVRIYEAGHEVPFYQPVVALSMFERVINGYDVATGKTKVKLGGGFLTDGPKTSDYREGNGTVQTKNIPSTWVYNTTTNEPNKPPGGGKEKRAEQGVRRKRKEFRPRLMGKREPSYVADFAGL
jgi:hypothetical protein